MYRKLLVTAAVVTAFIRVPAQQMNPIGAESQWKMIGAHCNDPLRYESNFFDRRQDVLYWSENEAVIPVQFETRSQGLVKVDNKARQLWEYRVSGRILGMARMGGQILVLHSLDNLKDVTDFVKTVTAVLVDPGTGRKVKEADILKFNGDSFHELVLHKDDQGNFQNLLVRQSAWEGGRMKMTRQVDQTNRVDVYALSAGLVAEKKKTIAGPADEGILVHSGVAPNGSLLLFWAGKEDFILEQHKADGKMSRITQPLDWSDKLQPVVRLGFHPAQPSRVLAGLTYEKKDRKLRVLLYDLETGKVKTTEEVMDRAYRKEMEATALAPGNRRAELEKNRYTESRVADVFFYGDQPVVVKESKGTITNPTSGSVRHYAGEIMISAYNAELAAPRHYLFPKWHETFAGGNASHGFHLFGDQMHLVANDFAAIATYGFRYAVLDLKAGQWKSMEFIREGTRQARSDNPIEAGATLWFPTGAVLHMMKKRMMDRDVTTFLRLVTLP